VGGFCKIGSGLWVGFGSLEWFYGRGYQLIGVAFAYECGLIDLVVGCCGLCRGLRPCGGWFLFFLFSFILFYFFMLLSAMVRGEKLRPWRWKKLLDRVEKDEDTVREKGRGRVRNNNKNE